jgi:hypothetical protein
MNVLQRKFMPRGIVMCPTPEAISTYGQSVPVSYIYSEWNDQVLQKIMGFQFGLKIRIDQQHQKEVADLEAKAIEDRPIRWSERMQRLQQKQIDENLSARQIQLLYEREIIEEQHEWEQLLAYRKQWAKQRKVELIEPYSLFVILDDLASDQEAIRSRTLKRICDNGRHFLMLLIISVQHSMDFPASCRGGLDWVVIFFETSSSNLKRLQHNYASELGNEKVLGEALAECARRNCCLVIDKRARSPNIYDCVFLFAPEEVYIPKSFFGDADYMWVHNLFYSQKKFNDSVTMGVVDTSSTKKSKQSKAAPSKSFSIEAIEKRTKAKKESVSGKKKKMNGNPSDYLPDVATNSWGDDEDYDPEQEQKRKEQEQVRQNVQMLRKKLKDQGKQGRLNAQSHYPPRTQDN